jgi:4-aminobutyrate aminotransferase
MAGFEAAVAAVAGAGAEPAYEELAKATAPRLVSDLPGPRARAVIEADRKVTSPSLPRAYPFVPWRGAGAVVEDVDGNRFLDFNAGIAVCSTGHAHPEVVEAVRAQAGRLLHYSGSDFYLPLYGETCEVLAGIAPMSCDARVFLGNSGTEAVEAAVKLARHHSGRQYAIAFLGGFHGRSYGAMSLTSSSSTYHERFGPLLPGVVHAPFGADDVDRYIERVIFARLVKPDEVAALVVEPVQGEGGYVVPPPGWLAYLRELCDRYGILLVADEVQCGMGRTGRMWALEHWGVQPDILLIGKGIASGMPLGAVVARADLMTWRAGAHGSTFGGNPLSCAAALATVRLLQGGLVDNAADVGRLLLDRLRDLAREVPEITEVRGLGLMVGVELARPALAARLEEACFRRGLLLLRAGDRAVRLSPPLTVGPDQVEAALSVLAAACRDLAGSEHSEPERPASPRGEVSPCSLRGEEASRGSPQAPPAWS